MSCIVGVGGDVRALVKKATAGRMSRPVRSPAIDELRAFCAAVDLGSLGRASRLLQISQPALSQRVRGLEGAVGTRLLERSPRGVAPTSAGTRLYAAAQALLLEMSNLDSLLMELSVGRLPVRIAASHTMAEFGLGDPLAEFEALMRTRPSASIIGLKENLRHTEVFYDHAFVDAAGVTKLGHGAYCSDAGYPRATEYTIGCHGVLQPDMRHTRYLLAWGWNATGAGGNKLCFITWPRQLLEARERGLKVIALDPRLRGAGPHADEWVPLRPGTDLGAWVANAT